MGDFPCRIRRRGLAPVLTAWTGTTQHGVAAADHCLWWTAASGANSAQGATNSTVTWSHLLGMPPAACTSNESLYCLED